MLRKYGALLSDVVLRLRDLEERFSTVGDLVIDGDLAIDLQYTIGLARILGNDFKSVLPQLDRIQKADLRLDTKHLSRDIRELRIRIQDDLSTTMFLYVQKPQYYTDKELFGPEVAAKFPKALDDIEDAGRSLAFGQGTSCVMHLMRVVEVGLKALAAALKIPYAPSWESYLNQIQTRIGAKHKTKGVRWKRDEKFFRDVSGDLLTVKQAWRNPTMHIERRYTVEEAEEIFRAVRTMMQGLAVKLAGV